jgi:arylsulfatase
VRDGKWKVVKRYQQTRELYDMNADRAELNDLAEVETAKRDELVALWENWATGNLVAFPERFNMYDWLEQQKARP